MKVFICGGGSGKQTERALKRLNEVIRHDLPCLYIPLAMREDQYDSCYEWVSGELRHVSPHRRQHLPYPYQLSSFRVGC